MEEDFKEPNFTNNVVCLKMANGETIIGLTNDDAVDCHEDIESINEYLKSVNSVH